MTEQDTKGGSFYNVVTQLIQAVESQNQIFDLESTGETWQILTF